MKDIHAKKLSKLSNDESLTQELTEIDLQQVAGGVAQNTCEDCEPPGDGPGQGGGN